MRIIKYLSDKIADEIEDAADYAKEAITEKAMYPWLAEILYTISLEESKHRQMLHEAVARLITEYRDKTGEPPADMLAKYEYLHKKYIEAAKDAKMYQEMYKDMHKEP